MTTKGVRTVDEKNEQAIAWKFIGFELKPSYFSVACDNLDDAVRLHDDGDVDLLNFHEQEVTA